ncbi:hypothetical protein DL765_003964 [Monosporascus sp. GIB2]|nr:hypothetical protein DL765_003964 [Monosporascus sp. GIB2]
MGKKRVLVSYGIDVDAVCGWLGSYGGEDSTSDISRGLFAGTVGTRRLLKLFEKYNMKTTWFIPGHSLETFPEEMAAVRDAGHEIGLHGYSHENPKDMSIEQQRDVLDKTYKMLTEFVGKPPRGSVAPWWECSKEGGQLLLDYGIEYDHSMSHHDCQPYYLRTGDKWTCIDYKKKAEEWMKPLVKGQETGLVEIPASWYLDDLPPMMFIKSSPNSHGFVNPRDVEDIWRDQFDYCYREYDEFIFPITIHPDVSGHPQVLLMHERLIEYFKKHEGVELMQGNKLKAESYPLFFESGSHLRYRCPDDPFGDIVQGNFRNSYAGCYSIADMANFVGGARLREVIGLLSLASYAIVGASGIFGSSTALNALSNHALSDRPAAAAQTGDYEFGCHVIEDVLFVAAITSIPRDILLHSRYIGFPPVISEIKKPRDYNKAVYPCMEIVTTSYLAFTLVVYACSKWAASPSLGSASDTIKKVAYGISLIGLLVSACLYIHVAAKYIFVRILRNSKHLRRNNFVRSSVWLGCTFGMIVVAFLIA